MSEAASASEAGSMIEVDGAGVAFERTWVFRRLSFKLARGETLAILGRNGRGKTTLLRALLGLQRWSEGGARVGGAIGYVPQSGRLPFAYSVLDVVLMGRARHLGMFAVPGAPDYQVARDALDALGMLSFETRRIDELSGGERQLVLIARALASECDLLILDEPASALDFHNQDVILSTIRRVSRESRLTVVFASHYPQHAIHVADKALLMQDVEDHSFGAAAEVMTEAALGRLYGIGMRKVQVSQNGHRITSLVPVFS
jgi:iron complex transport system ATP-binding protein